MRKYKKVLKKDYMNWYQAHEGYRDQVRQDPYRLSYHLMPETGWLNDPNGLCQFHGIYHIYYQYTPFEPTGELKLWGHYTTEDFIHYQREEPFLFPDEDFDAHGVYSGSAMVEDEVIHYFYTGNVKYFDRPDYDYIMSGRVSNTIHVTSRDGYHITDKELLLTNKDYPPDMSCHVRDPKVIKVGQDYYMVLGARDAESRGAVILYRSNDLRQWDYYSRITTKEPFGYMWECPDLFYLEGQLCLVCCPQGVKRQGIDFENVHQCVFMKLSYDFSQESSNPGAVGQIMQIDRGFDFYAPQSFEDEKGRRIMIAWMGIPDAAYKNPTAAAGWQHALTLPRELHIKNGRIIQTPIEELKMLRKGKSCYDSSAFHPGKDYGLVYESEIVFTGCRTMELTLRQGVLLSYRDSILSIDMGDAGCGRTKRSVRIAGLKELRIFSDTSSLEIFVNGGEEVFTTRVYSLIPAMELTGDCHGTVILYGLKGYQID